jgi:CTP:molybdopterin cytidylyltransferase MocA
MPLQQPQLRSMKASSVGLMLLAAGESSWVGNSRNLMAFPLALLPVQ